MSRSNLIASFALLPVFLAPAPAVVQAPPACPNIVTHEPLVLYDITGSSFAGPIDIALTVYNDGTARISSSNQLGLPSQAETVMVGAVDAHQLLLDLSALGAGHLCDSFQGIPDVPVSTLTVFRDAVDSRNHTFSWVLAQGAYAPVEQRLQDFIHSTFPNF